MVTVDKSPEPQRNLRATTSIQLLAYMIEMVIALKNYSLRTMVMASAVIQRYNVSILTQNGTRRTWALR